MCRPQDFAQTGVDVGQIGTHHDHIWPNFGQHQSLCPEACAEGSSWIAHLRILGHSVAHTLTGLAQEGDTTHVIYPVFVSDGPTWVPTHQCEYIASGTITG